MTKKEKGRQWDGKSRPSDDTYRRRWNEIFGKKEEDELKESYKQSLKNKKERDNYSNPVAKELRTPKYKSKVIKNKKKVDYFKMKSVRELLDEMDQERLKEIEDRNGF